MCIVTGHMSTCALLHCVCRHICTHTRSMHANTRTQFAQTFAHTCARAHARTHAHSHTRMHLHTHTHARSHTLEYITAHAAGHKLVDASAQVRSVWQGPGEHARCGRACPSLPQGHTIRHQVQNTSPPLLPALDAVWHSSLALHVDRDRAARGALVRAVWLRHTLRPLARRACSSATTQRPRQRA